MYKHKEAKSTRAKRKRQYIDARNLMRKYPGCAYNGDFYCNHEITPDGWVWVDFRFFHTTLQRYFFVALTTLEYNAYHENEEIVQNEIDSIVARPDIDNLFHDWENETVTFSEEWHQYYTTCQEMSVPKVRALNELPVTMAPSIETKDYGCVAVGVYATVSVSVIDEHVIRDFIKLFQSLGQPTEAGFKWVGEPVTVIPANIGKRGT